MNLRERLEAKELEQSILSIRGERFVIKEVDKATRGRVIADCRDKKDRLDPAKLEGRMLSLCVFDPDDGVIYSLDEWERWNKLGAGYTSPLFAEVMRLNGLDSDDVGREVGNSDTISTCG